MPHTCNLSSEEAEAEGHVKGYKHAHMITHIYTHANTKPGATLTRLNVSPSGGFSQGLLGEEFGVHSSLLKVKRASRMKEGSHPFISLAWY